MKKDRKERDRLNYIKTHRYIDRKKTVTAEKKGGKREWGQEREKKGNGDRRE
jgi:hypothetical protein